ncbi:hypothetical protein HLV35_05220 [Eggerthellaceae bacterium zg-997]|nr:hypothetical protein [Eggerthellaceae bacterium zg-997]
MDIFQHAAFQMTVLTLLAVAGVVARRLDFMNPAFDTMLSRLVVNFSLPALMLASVLNADHLPPFGDIATILGFSMLAYVLMMVLAFGLPRLVPSLAPAASGAHSFMLAFGNTSFVGLPVLGAVFGPQAVFYGVIVNIPFNLFVFTCGAAMVKRAGAAQAPKSLRRRARRVARDLMNPVMVACVAALLLAALGVTDKGGLVGSTLGYIGQMTVPASMLIIGSTLATMNPRDMLGHALPYATALMRLLGVPLILWAVLRLAIDDPLILGVIVVSSGMPVASMGIMMALMYDGDVRAMSQGTFITTVLALVTIPLLALVVW